MYRAPPGYPAPPPPQQPQTAGPKMSHVCFGRTLTCSGVNMCVKCDEVYRSYVLFHAFQRAGMTVEQVNAFLDGHREASIQLHVHMIHDPVLSANVLDLSRVRLEPSLPPAPPPMHAPPVYQHVPSPLRTAPTVQAPPSYHEEDAWQPPWPEASPSPAVPQYDHHAPSQAPSPPAAIVGEDARRVRDSLSQVASPEEIARRRQAARGFAEMTTPRVPIASVLEPPRVEVAQRQDVAPAFVYPIAEEIVEDDVAPFDLQPEDALEATDPAVEASAPAPAPAPASASVEVTSAPVATTLARPERLSTTAATALVPTPTGEELSPFDVAEAGAIVSLPSNEDDETPLNGAPRTSGAT